MVEAIHFGIKKDTHEISLGCQELLINNIYETFFVVF